MYIIIVIGFISWFGRGIAVVLVTIVHHYLYGNSRFSFVSVWQPSIPIVLSSIHICIYNHNCSIYNHHHHRHHQCGKDNDYNKPQGPGPTHFYQKIHFPFNLWYPSINECHFLPVFLSSSKSCHFCVRKLLRSIATISFSQHSWEFSFFRNAIQLL